ncbi:MAG: DNA repair protein RecN [Bacteroidales bacterium]|jgi:DNA repair protein RecN (Recombination protein N)|nr:DNA repair protein RecN [Bacteroidales bacterium]
MLTSLQIDNYALIRSLKIDFDTGYTVITGETGAGKSILLGALSLILGNRADTSALFDKSRKCVVEGCFNIAGLRLKPFFEEHDLDYADETVLRREITDNGKSRAFINDTPVGLQLLKELAVQLVDIHSQHNNLLFHQASFGLKIADEFAHNQVALAHYQKSFRNYQDVENKYLELKEIDRQESLERDFLQYVVQELQEACLTPEEQVLLEKEQAFLQNANTIKTRLFQALQLISEADTSALLQLQEAKQNLVAVSAFDERIANLEQRLNSALLDVKDIAFDLAKRENETEVNPTDLERISARLDYIYTLQQKHHVTHVEGLLQKLKESENKLVKINNYPTQLEELAIQKTVLFTSLQQEAQRLSQSRQAVLPQLEAALIEKIRLLGMNDGIVRFELTQNEQLGAYGIDRIKILFSANKGVAAEEISKVASGGELSRLMLAVKSILTASAFLPTVIFDEIDSGISGETAGKMAALMQEIATQRQLLVITHLPQIAAKGNLHYFVFKEINEACTTTSIRLLTPQERITELAKMMSGEHPGEASLLAAEELLN